jgi:hypothetical protein
MTMANGILLPVIPSHVKDVYSSIVMKFTGNTRQNWKETHERGGDGISAFPLWSEND